MEATEQNVKLSPPWDGHMSMLASFFAGDGRVKVGYCDDTRTGTIEVLDSRMYDALSQVLRTSIRFGNVTLKLNLVPKFEPKVCPKMTDLEALKVVLAQNPAFSKVKVQKAAAGAFVFVLFKPVVLQWYNDNLGNPWKLTTSTHELQADRVFKRGLGVSFTTEPPAGTKFRKGRK